MEILEQVEQLKAELDALRPLDPEIDARIWQKLRLDWNYHSNKLEGNTYSFGETKMLLLKGLTAGGKPVRDHEEISGHDEAIGFLIESIKEKEELTEVFIRHLHKMILVRPFWADAKTADGKPTKRLIKVGEYKTEPNHVETQTGEIFYFAEPIETPAKMQELVDWFRNRSSEEGMNAILLAAEFHYRFVSIHPFDDGNGRLARLLMNFILMKYGFPPVIIRNEDKDNYIAVLEQADFAILEPFVEYVAENLIRSLEVMINGAKGKDIEEPEDLDKELTLLEKRLQQNDDATQIQWSFQTVRGVLYTLFPLLVTAFVKACQKFDRFYFGSELSVRFVSEDQSTLKIKHVIVFCESVKDLIPSDVENLINQLGHAAAKKLEKVHIPELICVDINYTYKTLKSVDDESKYESFLAIEFNKSSYGVVFGNDGNLIDKSYSEPITSIEVDEIVRLIAVQHKQTLENLASEKRL